MQRDLGLFLQTSYKPVEEQQSILEKKKKVKLDPQLSDENTRVFYDENRGNPIIIHRGTQNKKDVIDDALIGVGLGHLGHRYKNSIRITKKAEEKYRKPAHAFGHSYGGWLAENSGAKGRIFTHNKAVGLGDIGKNFPRRQLDVSTKGDLISALSVTQKSKKKIIENKHKIKNIFTAHSTQNLP